MGIGIWELLIILAIVLVIFGAKRLRNLGSDVGGAIKSFKQAMKEDSDPGKTESTDGSAKRKRTNNGNGRVIDGKVVSKKKNQV